MRRNGTEAVVDLPRDGSSWASTVREGEAPTVDSTLTLGDITERVSCGVATGADRLFVQEKNEVPPQLRDDWTFPTLSGKKLKLNDGPDSDIVFICPYQEDGSLPPEDELDDFGDWAEIHRDRLEDRSCVKKNKRSWYGWHENPRWKTFSNRSSSVRISPRRRSSGSMRRATSSKHTVYYLIPEDHVDPEELAGYLNGPEAKAWLEANCQMAANGFYRLQTTVMEDLPVPERFGEVIKKRLSESFGYRLLASCPGPNLPGSCYAVRRPCTGCTGIKSVRYRPRRTDPNEVPHVARCQKSILAPEHYSLALHRPTGRTQTAIRREPFAEG